MNGTGYEYAAFNQLEAFESLAQTINEHQSRGKHNNHHQQVPAYAPVAGQYHLPASNSRPDTSSYDPSVANSGTSSSAASQHRMLLASVAGAYVHGSGHRYASSNVGNHQQQNNLASLFGIAPPSTTLADLQATMFHIQQQEQNRNQQLRGMGMGNCASHDQALAQRQLSQQSKQRTIQTSQQLAELLLRQHPNLLGSHEEAYPMAVASDNIAPNAHQSTVQPPMAMPSVFSSSTRPASEPWLKELKLSVTSLSLEPMTGEELEQRLRGNMHDVLTRYIPCVDFLVQCQQELRKGLEYATQRPRYGGKRRSSQNMTSTEFFSVYVDQLPKTFYKKNFQSMDQEALEAAYQGLQKLRQDAENSERQGCEAVKSNFLGGMKDGESWGLRKWLSSHGNALIVCTDLECILNAFKKIDGCNESTRKLAAIIRPMAKTAYDRLRNDIPSSYQQRSTAHPFLPFFHRLEAALRGMSTFDPDEDDVICIDDSDAEDDVVVDEVKSVASGFAAMLEFDAKMEKLADSEVDFASDYESDFHRSKRKAGVIDMVDTPTTPTINKRSETIDDDSSSGESDTESVIEIVETMFVTGTAENTDPDWTCDRCSTRNRGAYVLCQSCGAEVPFHTTFDNRNLLKESSLDCDSSVESSRNSLVQSKRSKKRDARSKKHHDESHIIIGEFVWPLLPLNKNALLNSAFTMAENLDRLASLFDECKEPMIRPTHIDLGSFWYGGRFADALRLLVDLLRKPESPCFVDHVDEDSLIKAGNPYFSHVIKHPICFREIAAALIHDVETNSTLRASSSEGCLPNSGLLKWNMWNGVELLMAVDLVLLNSLAYGKALNQGRSSQRSKTNQIRKDFWNAITSIVANNVKNEKDKKKFTPTRRSETSGFVVYKINET